MIEKYLDNLEQRIIPEVETELWTQWEDFWSGKFCEDIFSPHRPVGIHTRIT